MNRIEAKELFERISSMVILDARSPSEFAKGHIPGAKSLPVFDDDQRAQIGTLYKETGSAEATLLGLEIVGPKMRCLVEQAMRLAPDRKVVLHCWRGGQRSAALAWLLDFAGFDTKVIEGGYKAYRAEVHRGMVDSKYKFIVLGGRTGSGKTELLTNLSAADEQIVDLEALANHKGSAFGWIGEEEQPTTEQFENELCAQLRKLDPSRRIWLENESRGIGRVFLPDEFLSRINHSPLINIRVDLKSRVKRLVEMYARNHDELVVSFTKIAKKLGGQNLKAALHALELGDFEKATAIALVYYDKTYQYGLENTKAQSVRNIDLNGFDTSQHVSQLVDAAEAFERKHDPKRVSSA